MMRDLPAPAAWPVDERLRLPDGRQLAWHLYGDPHGAPIVFFHGFPGSRLQAALVHAQASAAGVALIACDRPGFGDSSPNPRARTVDAVIGDVHDLVEHLGLRRFGVIGVSCGGAYALASARLMPERVSAVGLLAGIGPMDRREARDGQLRALRLLFALARVHPALSLPMLALDALLFRSDAERALRVLSAMLAAPDRALLASDAHVRTRFGRSLADAYRQGPGAATMEATRIARHRSDTLHGIAQPVHVYQAGHDRHVPPAMGRFIASRLPRATLHDCPQEGHLSIVLNRFDDCARRVAQAGA